MFKWTLTATVQECLGVLISPGHQYTLLMRFDNKFSPPTPPAQVSASRLRFNAVLEVEFQTQGQEIPAQNVQILLVSTTPSGKASDNKQEIIGIATIKIAFPLSKDAQALKIHKFDKSFDSKATLKASLTLERTEIPMVVNQPLPNDALEEILRLQREEKEAYQSHLKFLERSLSEELIDEPEKVEKNGKWEDMVKERNELYKMSEDLYQELKKCMAQRDQYLRELREKQLSEQQVRDELQFLKLKIEEYQGGGTQQAAFLLEIERLRDENADLRNELDQKQDERKQLKRQVRESLLAMDDFRKEALQARSELINRESEISIITKHSRYLDPYDCILELYQQLQNRRLQDPFCFDSYPPPSPSEETVRGLKKETALLFTQLLQKMKLAKDRAWLVQMKVKFERQLDSLLGGE